MCRTYIYMLHIMHNYYICIIYIVCICITYKFCTQSTGLNRRGEVDILALFLVLWVESVMCSDRESKQTEQPLDPVTERWLMSL